MDIGKALYTLRMMTRGRDQRSDADREAEALIWQEHLRLFPADIVLVTLKNWPLRPDGQWWPTWHDVQKELEAQTSGRRLLADHIRSGKCLPAPKAEEEERDDSPEAVARRQAFCERHMRKLTPKEEPVDHVQDFDAWNARRSEEVTSQNKAGRFVLSGEAMEMFARKPRLSDEEFAKVLEAKEASSSLNPTPNTGRAA